MANTKELFRKYRVEADSLDDFLDTFYRHDRYEGRDGKVWGDDYSQSIKDSCELDLEQHGYCLISRHDSRTGDIVAFYA